MPEPTLQSLIPGGMVTHDFPLKLTAVIISLLFWVGYMQSAAPRDITVAFDGRIPVERPDVPAGFVLRAIPRCPTEDKDTVLRWLDKYADIGRRIGCSS